MATINQLRRIINNGYVNKTRKLLKAQVQGMSENEIFNAMTLSNIQLKPFSFNPKHKVNSLVTMENPGTCQLVRENNSNVFNKVLAKVFGIADAVDDTTESSLNYFIKKGDKNIGLFSMDVIDDTIRIGNFGIESDYRGSKTIMESMLAIRDKIVEFAKQKGISKVTTEVNDGNQQLLSLYQRFGFKPVAEVNFSSDFMDMHASQYLLEATI